MHSPRRCRAESFFVALLAAMVAMAHVPDVLVRASSTDDFSQVAKLQSDPTGANYYFGHSAAVSGGIIVVGAIKDGGKGAAYVFEKNSAGSYAQVGRLLASDGASDDMFGMDVAVSGGVIVVGAWFDDDAGFTNAGTVFIYAKDAITGSYVQKQKLTASDPAQADLFGRSVSISGDEIIVSSYQDDGPSNSGSFYVFKKNADTGLYEQAQKLTAADKAEKDFFGISIGIDEGVIIVGAPQDDDGGADSGSAYVFEKDADTGAYVQQQKLTAGDAAAGDQFGFSVSVSKGVIVVGAHKDDDAGSSSGSAYVFEKDADTGSYVQKQKLTAGDDEAGDGFGTGISISEGVIVVGAYRSDDAGSNSGSAYVFKKNSDSGSYAQVAKLVADDAAASDEFGRIGGVSVAAGVVVIGARNHGSNHGAAYVYGYTYTAPSTSPSTDGCCSYYHSKYGFNFQ